VNINLSSRQKLFLFSGFIIFYIFSVIIHFGYLPLNGDEPRRAIVAIEMLESGNFIMPTTMGWEYYNKPPFYNWLISLSMIITGTTSEISVRLPSLIFILVWGICNYLIVKRILSRPVALLSSLFLITSFDIFFWGLSNGGEIDIFYSFIVYLQVIFIFYFNEKKNWLALFAISYLFCAIGCLTKGFPSILFQGLTILTTCYYNKSMKLVFRWQHLIGVAIFGLIAGGYLYNYSFYSSPGILLADLLKEAFNKSAFGEFQEKIVKKIIEYPFSFLKILLPWSLLLLLLFKKCRFQISNIPLLRFSILFILFNIPVYWFTGHPRMRYSYMFIPFCMIIFAHIFYQYKQEYPQFINKVLKWAIIPFIIILSGILVLPWVYKINNVYLAIVIVLMILYIFIYLKHPEYYIFIFCTGIVVLRFAYSLIGIPIRYEKSSSHYDKEMEAIAVKNNFEPVSIYKRHDVLDLVIDLKLTNLNFGSIPAIPYLAYQMPYYYYQNTNHVVKFDTILQPDRNYIGFLSDLKGVKPNILYSFRDDNQHGDTIILFNISNPE
jgi:4-amino-4-deoxy-L-arabinose transferase-like glycosyltransferase